MFTQKHNTQHGVISTGWEISHMCFEDPLAMLVGCKHRLRYFDNACIYKHYLRYFDNACIYKHCRTELSSLRPVGMTLTKKFQVNSYIVALKSV